MTATAIWRLISATSSARRRCTSSSRCSPLALDARGFERQFEADLFGFGLLARADLGLVDEPPAGDFALLDLFLVLDPLLGRARSCGELRLLDLLARRDLGLLAFALPLGPILREREALRGAAQFDVMLLFEPRVLGLPLDVERASLRLEILGPDFDLGALLDLVAHAPACLDHFGQLGETFGVESVGAVEEFEAGLIEIDDGDVLEFEAVLGERLRGRRL